MALTDSQTKAGVRLLRDRENDGERLMDVKRVIALCAKAASTDDELVAVAYMAQSDSQYMQLVAIERDAIRTGAKSEWV